jgi:hypothetical protein
MIRLLTSVLLLGLAPAAFGQTGQPPEPVPFSPGAGSQSTPPTFPPGTARQERSKTSASSAEKAKTFVGTVVKESTGYALRVKDLSYKLDDQQQASNYEGRNVRILGNLDKHANTIHVQSIEQF